MLGRFRRYLYIVRLADGAEHPAFTQYLLNLDGMPDYAAIDFTGVAQGALVSSSLDAAGLHRQLSRALSPAHAADVQVDEVTAATLQESHLALTEGVRRRFLGNGQHYPNIQR